MEGGGGKVNDLKLFLRREAPSIDNFVRLSVHTSVITAATERPLKF